MSNFFYIEKCHLFLEVSNYLDPRIEFNTWGLVIKRATGLATSTVLGCELYCILNAGNGW